MPLDRVSQNAPFTPARPVSPRRPLPTVALRHDLPDGSRHVDWMLARSDDPAAGLITFRMDAPPDELPRGVAAEALRIADHRSAYLAYEGPVPGGRGTVRRIGRGRIIAWRAEGECRNIEVSWDEPARADVAVMRYRLEPLADGRWRVRRLDESPAPAAAEE